MLTAFQKLQPSTEFEAIHFKVTNLETYFGSGILIKNIIILVFLKI